MCLVFGIQDLGLTIKALGFDPEPQTKAVLPENPEKRYVLTAY